MNSSVVERGVEMFKEGTLNKVFAFYKFLIEIISDFKDRIQIAYLKDKHWSKIAKLLKGNIYLLGIQFYLRDNLIYYTDFIERIRLYLLKVFEKEIF